MTCLSTDTAIAEISSVELLKLEISPQVETQAWLKFVCLFAASGKNGKGKADELWADEKYRIQLTETGREHATSNNITILSKVSTISISKDNRAFCFVVN